MSFWLIKRTMSRSCASPYLDNAPARTEHIKENYKDLNESTDAHRAEPDIARAAVRDAAECHETQDKPSVEKEETAENYKQVHLRHSLRCV